MRTALHNQRVRTALITAATGVVIFFLAPRWPLVVFFSDVHAAIATEGWVPQLGWVEGWRWPAVRSIVSLLLGIFASLILVGKRQEPRSWPSRLLVIAILGASLVGYPQLREIALEHLVARNASALVVELHIGIFGGAPPVRLVINEDGRSVEHARLPDTSWLGRTAVCEKTLPKAELAALRAESNVLQFPPRLELEFFSLSEAWVRMSVITDSGVVIGAAGLVVNGRNAARFGAALSSILETLDLSHERLVACAAPEVVPKTFLELNSVARDQLE